MDGDLNKIFEFTKLINQFRQVERVVRANGSGRWENDAEHSYQLAMLAWYLLESGIIKTSLNKDLVIKYALAHDLVEVYAGDTYIFTDDENERATKEEREGEAAQRLEKEFPDFPELHQLIDAYEDKSDEESKFIYALDKLVPILNISLDKGGTWKEKGVGLNMLIKHKEDKINFSADVANLFAELKVFLKSNEQDLFDVKST